MLVIIATMMIPTQVGIIPLYLLMAKFQLVGKLPAVIVPSLVSAFGVFGLGKIDWQAGEASSQIAIAVMIVWRWTGYTALIYLAAMQAVPRDLYAAAALDGATGFQQFRKITVPAIRPTIVFTVIVSTIAGMQVLAEPLLFGGGSVTGGSDRQFQTLSLYLYEVGFYRWEFGYASAAAWITFALIMVAVLVNYLLVSRLRRH